MHCGFHVQQLIQHTRPATTLLNVVSKYDKALLVITDLRGSSRESNMTKPGHASDRKQPPVLIRSVCAGLSSCRSNTVTLTRSALWLPAEVFLFSTLAGLQTLLVVLIRFTV